MSLYRGLRLQMMLTFSLLVQSCYFYDQVKGRCDVGEREGESLCIIDLSDLKPPSTAEVTARLYPKGILLHNFRRLTAEDEIQGTACSLPRLYGSSCSYVDFCMRDLCIFSKS